MSLTKKAHENAVTSIADTDLVMVVGPNGGLHPISFSNLAKLVRNSIKIGGRNLLKNTGSLVVSGSNPVWLNSRFAVAGAVLKAEGGPLVFSCKYRKTGNPEGIVQLGMIVTTSNYDQQSWNASSLLSHGKLVKVFSRDDSFEDGSSFSLFALSIAGIELYDLKLERGNIATDWTPAPEDIASGLWGGVIGYLPITYNSEEKGGAHADERSFGRAEISADGHLAFGSLDALAEFCGRTCYGGFDECEFEVSADGCSGEQGSHLRFECSQPYRLLQCRQEHHPKSSNRNALWENSDIESRQLYCSVHFRLDSQFNDGADGLVIESFKLVYPHLKSVIRGKEVAYDD